jgi:hypothetical protein
VEGKVLTDVVATALVGSFWAWAMFGRTVTRRRLIWNGTFYGAVLVFFCFLIGTAGGWATEFGLALVFCGLLVLVCHDVRFVLKHPRSSWKDPEITI